MKQFGHRGWKYIVNFAIIHRSKGDSANIKSICLEWISSGVLADIILSSLNNFLFLFMWTNYLLVSISTPTTARYLACVASAQTGLPVSTLTTAFAHLHGFHRDPMKLSKSRHSFAPNPPVPCRLFLRKRSLQRLPGASLAAQRLKNLPAMQEMWV